MTGQTNVCQTQNQTITKSQHFVMDLIDKNIKPIIVNPKAKTMEAKLILQQLPQNKVMTALFKGQ